MKLTGKCLEDFFDYLRKNNKASIEIGVLIMHWQEYPKEYLNALIIEFFDSVGIYINISAIPFSKDFRVEIRAIDNSFLSSCGYEAFETRQKATNAAIEKANYLYNEL